MSKTWRKVAGASDYGPIYTPWAKRAANKKVRRTPDVPEHREFKKLFNSWDICDYKFRQFKHEFFHDYSYETGWLYYHRNDHTLNMGERWDDWVKKNYDRQDRFPRYWRRDRKRARNMKRSSGDVPGGLF